MLKNIGRLCVALLCYGGSGLLQADSSKILDLAQLETAVLENDLSLQRFDVAADAERQRVRPAESLPDPKLSLTAQNLPVDTFDFGQEQMTQAIVGLRQQIPRSGKRKINSAIQLVLAKQVDADAATTRLNLLKDVRAEWLKVYAAEQQIALLKSEEKILMRLGKALESTYLTGQSVRSDVTEITLKLAELSDIEITMEGQSNTSRARLTKWLARAETSKWPETLPEALLTQPAVALDRHPEIQRLETQEKLAALKVGLASEAYKPDWALEARYGYRQDRVDFVTVGVSIDLPLFTANRQDLEKKSSELKQQAEMLSRADRLAELESRHKALQRSAESLRKRLHIYGKKIVPEYQLQTRLARIEVESGSGRLDKVLNRELKSIQTKRKQLDVRIALAQAVIDLKYLAGE